MNVWKIGARFRRMGVLLASLLTMPLWGANLVSVSNGASTTEYATIQDALAACSGGETLTLLGNVSMTGSLYIDKPVTIDLGCYTLSNNSVQFIKPTADADGLVVRNGTLSSGDCCFGLGVGDYAVHASNVTFTTANVVMWGQGGRLYVHDGCVARTKWFVSKDGRNCRLIMDGGLVAPTLAMSNGNCSGLLDIIAGAFTVDPTAWTVDSSRVESCTETVSGIVCSYIVRPRALDDPLAARVTSADGATSREYISFSEAYKSCAEGETLTLLEDQALSSGVTTKSGIVLDLGGKRLSRVTAGHLFTHPSDVVGFVVRNGTLEAASDSCFSLQQGCGSLAVTNCMVKAPYLATGAGGPLALVDCVADVDYLTGDWSMVDMRFESGVYAPHIALSSGYQYQRRAEGRLKVSGGRYGVDMTEHLVSGYVQLREDAVVEGLVCRFKVVPAAEAGTVSAAEVVSADGSLTTAYATHAGAIAACPEGGSVRFLQSGTFTGGNLVVPRSMTIDLNGLRFANTSGDFLRVAAGATLNVRDGEIFGKGSIFWLNSGADSTVNVTNCALYGLCPLFGNATGVLNLYDCFMGNMELFGSSNGSATMNVHGGHYAYTKWRDGGSDKVDKGTRFNVYEGWLGTNPLKAGTSVVAEGSRVFYGEDRFRAQLFQHIVRTAEEQAALTVEATFEGVAHTNLEKALSVAAAWGGTVKMACDISRNVLTPNQPSASANELLLDFDGHELGCDSDVLGIYPGPVLTIDNGTIRVLANSKSAITLCSSANLRIGPGATLGAGAGFTTCGFYVPGNHSSLVIDGATIATTRMFSWAASGTDTAITIRGDGTNMCDSIFWPGTSLPASSTLAICGGWWKADPSIYVPANHVILHRAGVSPCPWRVRDWGKLCDEGWSFDMSDPLLGATGTGTLQAGTVEVSLTGAIPLRKTLLADLSAATVAEGGVVFSKSSALPSDVQISYEEGRLYAWQAKGTLLVVR